MDETPNRFSAEGVLPEASICSARRAFYNASTCSATPLVDNTIKPASFQVPISPLAFASQTVDLGCLTVHHAKAVLSKTQLIHHPAIKRIPAAFRFRNGQPARSTRSQSCAVLLTWRGREGELRTVG